MYRTAIALFSLLLWGCTRSPESEYAKCLREGAEFQRNKDYPRAVIQLRNASKAMPKRPEPYYRLGTIASAMGDAGSAAELLKQAVVLDPKHLDAMVALADLLIHSTYESTAVEGRKLAERVLAIQPENAKALNLVALAELREGQPGEASSRLQDVLKRTPNDVETSITLARVRLSQKDLKGAEDLLRHTAAASPESATALLALADFYNLTGDPQAAEYYVRGLRIQGDHAQALAALARFYVKAGRNLDADATFAQLAKSPDRRFRFAYAIRLVESGRKEAAIAEFVRISREDPTDREARTHLINAYLDANRISEVGQLLEEAISRNPKDAEALRQRARIHLSRGAPAAAETDLQVSLRYQPDSPEAHFLLAQAHGLRNQDRLQQQELNEALRLSPRYTPARVALSKLLTNQDPKEALDIVDKAPVPQQQEMALRIQRIWPLLELNRIEEARQAIAGLAGVRSPEVLLQDAMLHLRQKDCPAAQRRAQDALAANPAEVRALELILRCSAAENRPGGGLDIVRRHAAQYPAIAAVQMFLGRAEVGAGDRTRARAAFEAARAASGGAPAADLALVDLDIADRRLDEARRRVGPLLGRPYDAAATARLGLIEQVAGNYPAACEHYRKALQSNPREVLILNSLAYILAEFMGNPAEALRYAQAAKALAPENAAVDDTLGWTYYKVGSYSKAVQHLELAVGRAANARRQAHLAMAYARIGNRSRARQTLVAALKLDPQLPEASLARKVVDEGAIAAGNE